MLLFKWGTENYDKRGLADESLYVYDTTDNILESNILSSEISSYIMKTGVAIKEDINYSIRYKHTDIEGSIIITGTMQGTYVRAIASVSKFAVFYRYTDTESLYRFMNHIYFLGTNDDYTTIHPEVVSGIVVGDDKLYIRCKDGVLCLVHADTPHPAYIGDNGLVCVDDLPILEDNTDKIVSCMGRWDNKALLPYISSEVRKRLLLEV